MKIKVQIKRYCQKCNLHTTHLLKKQKAGTTSKMRWIQRQKKSRKCGNMGKFSKTPAKRYKVKRPHVKSNCTICQFQSFLRTRRSNKIEFLK